MGFRFRRSVKLFPGVRLNVTRSGVSATVGPRGLHTTVSSRRVTKTVDIPGSGLSYSSTTTSAPRALPVPRSPARTGAFFGVLAFVIAAACYVSELPIAGAAFLVVGLFFMLPSIAALLGPRTSATTTRDDS